MNVNINFNIPEPPNCGACDKGVMLPIQDISQDGILYLKGYVCSCCDFNILYKKGELIREKVLVKE